MLVPGIFPRLVSVCNQVPVLTFFVDHDVECGAVHIGFLELFVYCPHVQLTQIQVEGLQSSPDDLCLFIVNNVSYEIYNTHAEFNHRYQLNIEFEPVTNGFLQHYYDLCVE
jgi:hypothetical protein